MKSFLFAMLFLLTCVGCNHPDNQPSTVRTVLRMDCPDDAVSTVVYRRLNDLDYVVNPEATIKQLDAIEKKVEQMPDSCAKQSYRYWLPYFRGMASEFLQMDKASRAADEAARKGVPEP